MKEMRKVECISYPRSGHGILNKFLAFYFGDKSAEEIIDLCNKEKYFEIGAYVYCEIHKRPDMMIGRNLKTNFQKNHDFNLDTPIRGDRYYVIQIRNPVEAIVSYFYRQNKGKNFTQEKWDNFYPSKADYWIKFYKKWVKLDTQRKFILDYDEMKASSLKKLIMYMSDSNEIIDSKVEEGIIALDIRKRGKLHIFPFSTKCLRDMIINQEPLSQVYFDKKQGYI